MSHPTLLNILQLLKEKNKNFTIQNYIFGEEYRLRIKVENVSGEIDLRILNSDEYVLPKSDGFFVLNNAPIVGWYSRGMKTDHFSTNEEMLHILGSFIF